MADVNQILKKDYSAVKIDYTSKDYVTILDDLINSVPTISQKWNSQDLADPGNILIRLMSIVGDMLFYNLDQAAMEVYPNSVTQRKNAATIYKLIGYKMRWYKSATLQANIINTYSNGATIPRFCTFTTDNGSIVYTTFYDDYQLPSNMTNNGLETLIELVQGVPVTPVRVSNNPYPEAGGSWHSIYGYNYTKDDVVNNRIYLKDTNIDQEHIMIIDDKGDQWALQENIYLTRDVGKMFEFGVDVNDQPYLELVDYWENYNVNKFKIFYVTSLGEEGQIYANTLKTLSGSVWSRSGTADGQNVYNVSGFIHFTHYDSTAGYNPETPDEARKNSVLYQNTLDTIITLADFERAVLREPGVANVRATDLTNDPGQVVSFTVGNIKQFEYYDMEGRRQETITEQDMDLLKDHLAADPNDPNDAKYLLTAYQQKLADLNQDGVVDGKDLACFEAYFAGDYANAGVCGKQKLENLEMLGGFAVKLYILRTEAYEDMADDTYESMILTDLEQYKILPLNVSVDLHSINRYYWSIEGKFFTKEPLSRDELQNIIVNINNQLRYQYAIDKTNFNTLINYKEVIETILAVDSRILMVDLEPIRYLDEEGKDVSKEQLTGDYIQVVPAEKGHTLYTIYLDHTTVLPGSVMIKLNGGEYILRDNNNGEIPNENSCLVRKGKIDYATGEIVIELSEDAIQDIVISYTHNTTNVALYRNLSTQTFYFDPSSLQADEMADII